LPTGIGEQRGTAQSEDHCIQTTLSTVIASGTTILSQSGVITIQSVPVRWYNLIADHWSTNFANCWKKLGLLDYYTSEYADPGEGYDIRRRSRRCCLHASNMSVGEPLNPSEKNIVMEDPRTRTSVALIPILKTKLEAS
ncbi:hypothetical protein JG687_00004659, partial [Phytophthora cactorum]